MYGTTTEQLYLFADPNKHAKEVNWNAHDRHIQSAIMFIVTTSAKLLSYQPSLQP